MTPNRYERITDLFDAARQLAPDRRISFLNDSCDGDDSLRVDVERLLRSHDANADFLDTPVVAPELRRLAIERLLRIDDELVASAGPWRLTRLLGEGGFARVYLGEQDAPIRRRVAVKVLREGSLSPQAIARLNAESQALALLDHPNIVGALHSGQLNDGTNRPFFVMEYVEGETITAHCRRKDLGLRARVDLYLELCDAIQHAHNRGVLHRDLKPSNVLVTSADGRAVVKIIDFGVAKGMGDTHLSEASIRTADGELVGTLGYMSPEQLKGSADTRSDVYALGVLLYELCTDRLPIEVKGAAIVEAARRVQEQVVVPASAFSRACRGDLDVILSTALEKDPVRRYQTAGELAADLRRYLAGEPILARRPSLTYLARSYARRHRTSVVLAAALFVVGAAGLALILVENSHARHAEERWAQRVRDAVQRNLASLESRAGTLEDRTAIANDAFSDALELLGRRPREARFLDLAAEAARQRSKIALERNDSNQAFEFGRRAMEWRQQAVEREPADERIRASLAIDYVLLGDACFAQSRLGEMRNWFLQSAQATEVLATRDPSSENQVRLAWSYQRLAAADLHAGNVAAAIDEGRQSLRLTDAILAQEPDDTSALGCARQTQIYLASLHQRRGELDVAAQHSAISLQLADRLYQIEPSNREHIFGLLHAWMDAGDRMASRCDARVHYDRGYELAVSRVRTDPHHEKFLRYAACFSLRLALCARDEADLVAAARWTREGVAYAEGMPGNSAGDIWALSSMYFEAREILRTIGYTDDQNTCDVRLRELSGQLAGETDAAAEWLRSAAEMLLALDDEEDQRHALEMATAALSRSTEETPVLLQTLARAYLARGDRAAALTLLERAANLATNEASKCEIAKTISTLAKEVGPEALP